MSHVARADVCIKFSVIIPFKDDGKTDLNDQFKNELDDSVMFCCHYADEFDIQTDVENLNIVEMKG